MAKLETCDVFLPDLGVSLGFIFQAGKWSCVGPIQTRAKPRNAEPIRAFVRRTRARARRNLH
jgi:hypothetical protein